jgi:translation initiation factor 2B subunit (eIF-2B alpha/beta/delta family)
MVLNYIKKKKEFKKICKDIKEIKIQGARNVARAALKAYYLFPKKKTIKKLLKLRPTEPMMKKVLYYAQKKTKKEILSHFNEAQDKINRNVFKLIKNNDVIFTHCHSTNVINALIYTKSKGKKFQVYNTETRPLFQGRKTAKELRKNNIKVTMFVDSGVSIALKKSQNTKKVDLVLLGADAITDKGAINKIGSTTISQIAKDNEIPVYVVADSWKYTNHNPEIEKRPLNEVWDRAPKNIKILNPAFEFIDKSLIKGVVSDLGNFRFEKFVRLAKNI